MEQNAGRIADLLKALANENRLLILCALVKGPKAVNRLQESIPNITQPALSQHLSLMKAHGILDCQKSGQSVTYFIADHRVEEIMSVLKHYYCDCAPDGAKEA
jgi:DNA-binding transcriptional ArsR family regulator